eukprot:GAHX01000843.1.p1 GENE.GAHX01000843.1~~GAHX01000843.1.p1  ORF type:complete len:454 (-),score=72.15 GAHX01000843.1:130-1491(-)
MNSALSLSLCLYLIRKITAGSITFSNEVFNETFEDLFVGLIATQPDDFAVYNNMIEDVKRYVEGDTSVDITNYSGFKFYIYKIETKCSISRLLRRNCIKNFWLFRVNARDLVDLFNLQTAATLIHVFLEFDSSKALLYSLYLHYLKYILTFDLETLSWHQGIDVDYTQLFKGVPKDRRRWYNLVLPQWARPNSQPLNLCISIQTPNLLAYLSKRIVFYIENNDSNQPREQADYPEIILKYLIEIQFTYIDPNGDLNDINNIRFVTIIPVGIEIEIPGGIVCKTSELIGTIPIPTTTTTTTSTHTETHSEHSNHSHSSSGSHGKSGKSDHSSNGGHNHQSHSNSSGSGTGKHGKKKKKKRKRRNKKEKKERKIRLIEGLFERIKRKNERQKQRELELQEDAEFFELELLEIDILGSDVCSGGNFITYPVVFRNTSQSGGRGKSSSKSSSSHHTD